MATRRRSGAGPDAAARDGVYRRATGVLRVYSDRGGQIIPALIDRSQRRAAARSTNINLAAPSLETLFICR